VWPLRISNSWSCNTSTRSDGVAHIVSLGRSRGLETKVGTKRFEKKAPDSPCHVEGTRCSQCAGREGPRDRLGLGHSTVCLATCRTEFSCWNSETPTNQRECVPGVLGDMCSSALQMRPYFDKIFILSVWSQLTNVSINNLKRRFVLLTAMFHVLLNKTQQTLKIFLKKWNTEENIKI
jgi:hypothetical protein